MRSIWFADNNRAIFLKLEPDLWQDAGHQPNYQLLITHLRTFLLTISNLLAPSSLTSKALKKKSSRG